MHGRCLSDFLEELGEAGELVRVEAEVDPRLEIAEITARVCRGGRPGPAVSRRARAGNPRPDQSAGDRGAFVPGLGGRRLERAYRPHRPADRAGPERGLVGSPPQCRRRERPWPMCCRGKSGRPPASRSSAWAATWIWACCRWCRPPRRRRPGDSGRDGLYGGARFAPAGVGLLRPDAAGRDRLAVGWAAHDEPARLLAEYGRRRGRMPLAVALGGEPAAVVAAAVGWSPQRGTPSPWPASSASGRWTSSRAAASSWPCPPKRKSCWRATSIPRSRRPRPGRWSRRWALCAASQPAPVHARHRRDAAGQSGLLGHAPRPAAQRNRRHPPGDGRGVPAAGARTIPELVDYDLPLFGAGRHWAVLAIRKGYAGQARRVAALARGLPPLALAKFLVVVDAEIDVRDHRQVLAAMAAHVNPGRDVVVDEGPPDPWMRPCPPARSAAGWSSTPRPSCLPSGRGPARSRRG